MLIFDRLIQRTLTDGASPFLTHYRGQERTELSARSFANWVAKTANLLVDEYGLGPGDTVRLTVAEAHPAHWMTLIWTMGAWQAGLTVVDTAADLEVAGPDVTTPADGPAVACSLHPLGRGLTELPAGWTDYSIAALAQPDDWYGITAAESDPAWAVGGERRTFAELAEVDARGGRSVVSGALDRWKAVRICLLSPLLGGGSTVVVAGQPVAPDLERIAEAEKADL